MRVSLLPGVLVMGILAGSDEQNKAQVSAKLKVTQKQDVVQFYADEITQEGIFTMVRFSGEPGLAVSKGGLKFRVEDGKVHTIYPDLTTARLDESGAPRFTASNHVDGALDAQDFFVMVGKGEFIVRFRPEADEKGEVQLTSLSFAVLDGAAPMFTALPNTPPAGLDAAIKASRARK